MRKSVFIPIFISIFLILSSGRLLASESGGLSAYVAAGPNFIFPTSVRLGWNQWEAGMLAKNFVGASKTFPISGKSTYAAFGIGFASEPVSNNLGFQSSIGFNFDLFMNIGFRGEILANASLSGNTVSHGLVGISYGF